MTYGMVDVNVIERDGNGDGDGDRGRSGILDEMAVVGMNLVWELW
jgi:hypothetical protein